MSFISKKVPTFHKDKRDLFVKLYSHEYESDYKNQLGPGPAAYSRDQTHTQQKIISSTMGTIPKAKRDVSEKS